MRLRALLLLLPLLAAPLCALPADALRDRIAARSAKTQSIQADLDQEKHLSVFKETIRSAGTFAFARPDRLRWELTSPVRSGFVLRGATGERWHEMGKRETFSVDRDPVMRAVSDQLIAWATADFARLEAQYEIAILSPAPVRFRLVPRSAGLREQIVGIEVSFSPDESYVEEVVVREKNGDFTRLRFRNVRLNAPIPAGTF